MLREFLPYSILSLLYKCDSCMSKSINDRFGLFLIVVEIAPFCVVFSQLLFKIFGIFCVKDVLCCVLRVMLCIAIQPLPNFRRNPQCTVKCSLCVLLSPWLFCLFSLHVYNSATLHTISCVVKHASYFSQHSQSVWKLTST